MGFRALSCTGDWRDKQLEITREEFIAHLSRQGCHYNETAPDVIDEDSFAETEWCVMEGHIIQTECNNQIPIDRPNQYMLASIFD